MEAAPSAPVEQQLAEVCGTLNTTYARLVALVAGALADGSWQGDGIRSPEHWLRLRAGLSPGRARRVVALARRRPELPAVMAAFGAGQLSVDQVDVVAAHTPAAYDASVAELAVHASVPQLRRALSRYAFDPAGAAPSDDPTGAAADTATDADPDPTDADPAAPGAGDGASSPATGDPVEEPAELVMTLDGGRFTLRFTAPADTGALIEAALHEAKDALFHAGHPHATWAEALTEVCARSRGTVTSPSRLDAFRVYVHLDTDPTTNTTRAWLNARPALPDHLRAKLTCDATVHPLWHTHGAPVSVGRAHRIVPDRTRRLIRDRGCRFPACTATAHVEIHHLTHWADGGPTDTPNLLSLCPYHHDGHHRGDFTLTGNADDPHGLTFTDRTGHPINPGPHYRPPPDGPPDARSYAGPTGETLHTKWVTFTAGAAHTAIPA